MSTSPELMYAILAMDAYNRSYNAGIEGLGGLLSQIGTATLVTDSETRPETQQDAQTAGFYAVAYQWNGNTIMASRRRRPWRRP